MGNSEPSKLIIPKNETNLYFGDIRFNKYNYYTNSSRTLCVITTGNNVTEMYNHNEEIINSITGNFHYRTDIGIHMNYKSSGVDIDNYNAY